MDEDFSTLLSRRAPRYTSYPTAVQFSDAIGETDAHAWLWGLPDGAPLSLYLHVPFCAQVCWYCACNMKLARREEPVREYAAALVDEVALVAGALGRRMPAARIHWGGGTPTSMPADAMAAVMAEVRARFAVAPDAEIAFELDPRTFRAGMAGHLADFGATRVSLGVQEFDAKVQKAVNRIQPYEVVRDTVDACRGAGIGGVNFDLIYGLPHQTVGTIARTIERTLELAPDRIALFGYAHVPWMAKRQRMLPEAALPDGPARIEQAATAARLLVEGGYVQIGLDHFARPGDGLVSALRGGRLRRNFQGYVDDPATALIGIGATAISELPQGYWQNIGETGAWGRAVGDGALPVARGVAVTAEDRLRREIIERLMCDMAADTGEIARRHGMPADHFAPELDACRELARAGVAEVDGGTVRVPERGRPALRVIAAVFDAYLPSAMGRHSVAH